MAGDAAGFQSRGQVARVVPAKAAAAQRAEKILQRFETKKIDGLVGNFEASLRLAFAWLTELAARGSLRWWGHLRRLLRIDEAFVGQAFSEFVKQIFHRLAGHGVGISKHFAYFGP